MIFRRAHKPIVFAGATLNSASNEYKGLIDIRPPAQLGDLIAAAIEKPNSPILLLEGLFGGNLAVTVRECRDTLSTGTTLIGAASLGALRANELWSLGMIGIGEVYLMYRLGKIHADSELAVMYDPRSWTELTVSTIHLRALLRQLTEEKLLEESMMKELIRKANKVYWVERTWDAIFKAWRSNNISQDILARLKWLGEQPEYHPKIQDAHYALGLLCCTEWPTKPHETIPATMK